MSLASGREPLVLRPAFLIPFALLLALLYGAWVMVTAEPPPPPTIRTTVPISIGAYETELVVRPGLKIHLETEAAGDNSLAFYSRKEIDSSFRRIDELLREADMVPAHSLFYRGLCGVAAEYLCARRNGGWSVDFDFISIEAIPAGTPHRRLPEPPRNFIDEVTGDMIWLRDGSFRLALGPGEGDGDVTCSSPFRPSNVRTCNAWIRFADTITLRIGFAVAAPPDERATRELIAEAGAFAGDVLGVKPAE